MLCQNVGLGVVFGLWCICQVIVVLYDLLGLVLFLGSCVYLFDGCWIIVGYDGEVYFDDLFVQSCLCVEIEIGCCEVEVVVVGVVDGMFLCIGLLCCLLVFL